MTVSVEFFLREPKNILPSEFVHAREKKNNSFDERLCENSVQNEGVLSEPQKRQKYQLIWK